MDEDELEILTASWAVSFGARFTSHCASVSSYIRGGVGSDNS